MGTRWKNRMKFALWTFLFTIGISGIISYFDNGINYVYRDYFHTPDFQYEIEQFAQYVGMFEINDTTLEEAKKSITVSDEEINEHRYRYGNLNEQIQNIKSQYEGKIQEAEMLDNKELQDSYIAERDKKIADITKNFESDDYVKAKIIKEKEKKLEEYFKSIKRLYPDAMKYKDGFQYYFTDQKTGEVYSSLENQRNKSEGPENAVYTRNYTMGEDKFLEYGYLDNFNLRDAILPKSAGTLEGKIWVTSSSNWILQEREAYKDKQILYLGYVLTGILGLILCLFFAKRAKELPMEVENLRPYYNKLPIDLRGIFIIFSAIGTIIAMWATADWLNYTLDNPVVNGIYFLLCLIIATIAFGLTFAQWLFLIPALVKDWQNLKGEWQESLLNKTRRYVKRLYNKIFALLKEAFLDWSTGTQFFLLLGAVFVLGFSAVMVIFFGQIYIFFYILMLGFIGIPLLLVLVKNVGYFNRIMAKTDELAAGNLGPDLELTGKSVLAKLAGNINFLKQGVKTSQSEQAKSERLKTELITNVSHDLRTPLTSIITYTELLKKEDISNDERDAYLEIIDRKSKRLKILIDDLFEVSKMASGNIQLTKEKVDLVQLLQQALAEYDNAMNESSLQFRIAQPENPVYAMVDGQKLWRVFDNLIGNILKYSLDNSRVYISVGVSNGQAVITFKNVSKYELNDSSEELFERFKRGDTSRNTEGSGLGLAIAKSIVDLHEGNLDIETDGDLFKVTITLDMEQ